ncbi:hypothetical protein ASC95_27495 [Pelomonas sp. Root1217]|uniref:hypothetical protein n=1 Tax=Pelomonas sp. Root1217 TaxID=1736430 RepID=UPI0007131FA5|nr:hypothetical protein [Pelomonas sp. Root1217]KQV45763.1 hypothetical protein ASC95_27495 [Pelomonas sp. Root1217]
MFVSHPEYQSPMPPALDDPGTLHWRMVELSLHAPWFLLSVEFVDPTERDRSITRTLCIARDHDLADVLRPLDPERVKGIVCMMPAWQSPTGQWWSREIREVWILSSHSGQHIVLADNAGQEFDCGLIPEHVGDVEKQLLIRVKPKPAPGDSNRRAGGAASRRTKSS